MPDEFDVGSDPQDPFAAAAAPAPAPRAKAPSRGRNVLSENLLLVVLFAGGLAGVYALSLRGGPKTAMAEPSATETQVETAITALSSQTANISAKKGQEIIDGFDAHPRQVSPDAVKGNPFVFRSHPVATSATRGSTAAPTPTPASEADAGLAAAMKSVKQMKLQSILSGQKGRPMALISNNLLGEGQSISGWVVTKITAREVELTCKDQQYVLKME